MRCLVTGASGHLGSFLTKRLTQAGWDVSSLVRPESDLWRLSDIIDQITIIQADLSQIASAAPEITKAKPEAVFHLAWQGVTSASKNDPRQLTDNVSGSLNLFDIVKDAGCKLWLGVGSQAEYGRDEGVLTEDTPLNPETAYGVAKLRVGRQTKSLCELAGIRYVWFRLLATYGPMDDERHLIPSVIRQLLLGQRPRLTLGEQYWDYLYIEDAVEALYRAAASEDVAGVFNLGSGVSFKVREIVERIRDLIDPALALGFGDRQYPADQVMRLETSIDRIRAVTGWFPRVPLDVGLSRTVEWYKRQLR